MAVRVRAENAPRSRGEWRFLRSWRVQAAQERGRIRDEFWKDATYGEQERCRGLMVATRREEMFPERRERVEEELDEFREYASHFN